MTGARKGLFAKSPFGPEIAMKLDFAALADEVIE